MRVEREPPEREDPVGWTHTRGADRKGIIEEIKRGFINCDVIATRCVGSHFWVVARPLDGEAAIVLFLLRGDRNFGWGYKDMDEAMHPYCYTCPEKLLELAPETCPEWRENVRAYHAKRKRKLEVGVTYELPNCTPDRITLTSVKPLRGEGSDGRLYRITKNRLGEKVA